uniref:G-protein coupled receptors family 1 profile domain-containing protein n=1 Tax=Sus scrofa TaxID=9823 RepID=A0A8D1YVA1_PIG
MRGANQSSVCEFLLLGLSRQPRRQQQLLFLLFLGMYLATVLGNLLILLAISLDARLHRPMYFFLSKLSFVDVCFSSTTVPKILGEPPSEEALRTPSTRPIRGCVVWLSLLRPL